MVACAYNPSYSGGWAGEMPEPERGRLKWAEILPLHSSLEDKAKLSLKKKKHHRPGAVAHTYNPSTLRGQGKRITEAQEFKITLGNMANFHLLKKRNREGEGERKETIWINYLIYLCK